MAISGIGVIKNINTNKEFVFKSYNLEKQWEIYQNQLNLKIHHNKNLQEDWNNLGSSNFDFIIIERIDDEFIMLEEFEDYLLTSDNYNSFEISDFYFEYSSNDVITLLYQIIGRDNCSVNFKETLELNGLSANYYEEIKKEMISLISDNLVNSENLNDKLDELISEKAQENRIVSLNLQEKLFDQLYEIVGIGGLKKEFISTLNENKLSEKIGYKIRENIEELIFLNNVFENDIHKQIDLCISKYYDKASEENIKKLLFKADSLENDELFLNNVSNLNFTSENILNVITQLKDLISSAIVFEDNFDEKLNQIIDIEAEKIRQENKNKLINYLNETLGENDINPILKDKLKSNYLDLTLVLKFNELILESIENEEISTNNEIDLKLDQLINEEISSINQLKDDLLVFLEEHYGVNELSKSFKIKLNKVQLSVDDGKEFTKLLSNEISSFKIKSPKAISIRVDELIFEKNKEILKNQFNNLVGDDKNTDSFSTKLKFNYLTNQDGYEIRTELQDLINNVSEIQEVIDLRNSLELKVDELISQRGQQNYNKLKNISDELIQSINKIIGYAGINDSFKSKLYSHNLGEEYGTLIKDELIDYIKKEDPNSDYESKMNQLNAFKTKTVELVIDETIEKKSIKRNEEYKLLKSQLVTQLYDIIGLNENTDYFNELLLEHDLDNSASLTIREEFKEIIESDEVYNQDKFNYKYEELSFIKSETVEEILLDLVKNQKNIYKNRLTEVRSELLEQLYEIIGKDVVIDSFQKRLYSNELSLDYAQSFKIEIKEFICTDTVYDNKFQSKFYELTDLKDRGIDTKIQELIDRESKIKYEDLRILKKELTKELEVLTSGKRYADLLKSNYLSTEVGKDIKKEIYVLINSYQVVNSQFNNKTEELINLKETGIKNKLETFINKYRKIYDEKLLNVRENLKDYVYKIIGKDEINIEFKNKLTDNYLPDNFAEDIKNEILNFIDSDDVYDKKFEDKLDELSSLNNENISDKINEIIKREYNSRQEKLKQTRKELNTNLTDLVGLNNDYFNNLLKNNHLNSKTGNEIKNELSNLINSDEIIDNKYQFKLDELNNIKDIGVENKLNEIISLKVKEYDNEIFKLRDYFKKELVRIIYAKSFKDKLFKNQLDYSFKEKFEKEILDFVNSDEVFNSKFEVKLDELRDFKKQSIDLKLDELIQRESNIKFQELSDIRIELKKSLDDLIGMNSNTEYYNNLLKSNNLNSNTGKEIRLQLNDLILSDYVFDDSFDFKLEELHALKQEGIKNRLNEIINNQSDIYNSNLVNIRATLIEDLNKIVESHEFKNRLHNNQLHYVYKDKFKKEISDFINTDEISNSKFEVKLDELIDLNKFGIDSKLGDLIDRESKIKLQQKSDIQEEFTSSLNELIGLKTNNEYYNNLLKSNNLNSNIGKSIRSELFELILSDKPVNSRYEFKLDELLDLKDTGIENQLKKIIDRESAEYLKNLKLIREKLLNSLKRALSKNSLNEELYSKQIDDSFIEVINNDLLNLINSEIPNDKKFEFKLDELNSISKIGVDNYMHQLIKTEAEIRQKELIELKKILAENLYKIIGKNSNSYVFNLKLVNYNFNQETKNKIRNELITLISSESPVDEKFNYKLAELKYLNDYGLENKVDDVLNREKENYDLTIKEKRKNLIDSINEIIGKNTINPDFKHKLQSFGLNENFAIEIKNGLIENINSDEVTDDKFSVKLDELVDLENNGIESKIDEIIQNELDIRNSILKESLLKKLHDITGNTDLSESFIEKLNKSSFDEETGYKIKKYYESEIDSLKINKDFDFESAIDDMIIDEIRNKLLNQTYEIIGRKSNSDYYNNKLKESMISSQRGDEIKNDVISQINDSDLDNLIKLKNKGMQDELDKLISEEAISRQNRQMELRMNLLSDLNNSIRSDSFKEELKSKNLDKNYIYLIKSEIRDLIRSDEIYGDFEFKIDELEDINQRGINNEIERAVDKYSNEVNEKYKEIKNQLLNDLDLYSKQLSSNVSFDSYGIKSELKIRDLSKEFGQKAIDELEKIINSDKIINYKFSTKLSELEDIKETTVKIKLIELLDEYSGYQKYLINSLTTYLNTVEFSQKLKNKNLYPETSNNILVDLKEKIKNGKITSSNDIEGAVENYINNESFEIKKALNALYEIVGSNGISFKFKARLRINGLSSNKGKLIAQNVENKIRTEKLRDNGVKREVDNQIKMFIENKNKKPVSHSINNTPKYVFCQQCGHKNINGNNFCEQCGSRLAKLRG